MSSTKRVAALGLLRGGCWCHLRRYFFDARHHHPAEARLTLGTIRDLFAIEAGLVGAPLEIIRGTRDRDSRPLVQGLYDWILGLRLSTRPTSLLGEPLTYAVNTTGRCLVFRSRSGAVPDEADFPRRSVPYRCVRRRRPQAR